MGKDSLICAQARKIKIEYHSFVIFIIQVNRYLANSSYSTTASSPFRQSRAKNSFFCSGQSESMNSRCALQNFPRVNLAAADGL